MGDAEMKPTIRIVQRACEAAKARQAVAVFFDEHGQFAAIILAGLPVDLPGKTYGEAAKWTARMVCEVRELANGVHRMKRRAPGSRYWDCAKCKQFLHDERPVARSRISARVAERAFGRCPTQPRNPDAK